jgi:hypothetical protein
MWVKFLWQENMEPGEAFDRTLKEYGLIASPVDVLCPNRFPVFLRGGFCKFADVSVECCEIPPLGHILGNHIDPSEWMIYGHCPLPFGWGTKGAIALDW